MFDLDPIEAGFLRELALAAIENRYVIAPYLSKAAAFRARRRLAAAGLARCCQVGRPGHKGGRRLGQWRITPAGLDLLAARYHARFPV